MFEIVRTLSPSTVESLKTYLPENLTLVKNEVESSYAKDRMESWIGHKAALTKRQYIKMGNRVFEPRPNPKRIGEYLVKVWQECGMPGKPEIALANFGPIGIDWHADATYAHEDSLLINLGGVTWGFNPNREHAKLSEVDSIADFHTLDTGEVIRFNCKNQHEAIEPHPERWSIVLWRISNRMRPVWNAYQQGQTQSWPEYRRY